MDCLHGCGDIGMLIAYCLCMIMYVHANMVSTDVMYCSFMFMLVHSGSFFSFLLTHAGKAIGEEIDGVHVGIRSFNLIQQTLSDGCPSHFQDVTVSIHDWKSLSQWNPEPLGKTAM